MGKFSSKLIPTGNSILGIVNNELCEEIISLTNRILHSIFLIYQRLKISANLIKRGVNRQDWHPKLIVIVFFILNTGMVVLQRNGFNIGVFKVVSISK